jgi:hypothetical protein
MLKHRQILIFAMLTVTVAMLLTPMLSYIDLGNQADHLLELERVTLQNQVEVSDELDDDGGNSSSSSMSSMT